MMQQQYAEGVNPGDRWSSIKWWLAAIEENGGTGNKALSLVPWGCPRRQLVSYTSRFQITSVFGSVSMIVV